MADPKPKEVVTHRLTQDVYKALEAGLPVPFVNQHTSDLQAGFALGIQFVLKQLREGFVVP